MKPKDDFEKVKWKTACLEVIKKIYTKKIRQQTAQEMKEYFRSLIFEHLNDFVIEKCNISDLKEERDIILRRIKQKYLDDKK